MEVTISNTGSQLPRSITDISRIRAMTGLNSVSIMWLSRIVYHDTSIGQHVEVAIIVSCYNQIAILI